MPIHEPMLCPIKIFGIFGKRVLVSIWIASKSSWTPYDNVKVRGFPVITIVGGNVIMTENQILSKPSGKPVKFSYD